MSPEMKAEVLARIAEIGKRLAHAASHGSVVPQVALEMTQRLEVARAAYSRIRRGDGSPVASLRVLMAALNRGSKTGDGRSVQALIDAIRRDETEG